MEDRPNKFIMNEPVDKVLEKYMEALKIEPKMEKIRVEESLGRVTSKAVIAENSSPSYNSAAMDGIVVKAIKSYGASERNPITLKYEEDFNYVNTGNLIEETKDSVIMIEDVNIDEDGNAKIIKATYPWENIRPVGEDIVMGEMIIPSKHKIRALDLGALINGGVEEIYVYKKPKIGIIPTGDEIVQKKELLGPGKIIDSNSQVFSALISEQGACGIIYSVVNDNKEKLKKKIKEALENNDFLIINAGSSAGKKDFTSQVLEEMGEIICHGVALKPGKPTILAKIDGKGVIGIPGYPVSSYIVFKTFVEPVLRLFTGESMKREYIEAYLSKRIVSSFKYKEIVRVTLGKVKEKWIATALTRGAGATMSLVRAHGVIEIEREVEGLEAGEKVKVELLRDLDRIKENIVFIGSHDLLLDYIADKIPLTSAHVGSFGGILSLRKKECHIAPIHLINPQNGEYNKSVLGENFEKGTMALIKGVKRLQGFIVGKGNPKNIRKFEDLAREGISFVNRQKGAGTRQLLDYNLKKYNIDSKEIMGYEREYSTHLAVAVAVQSGSADVGLGVYSASKIMDLDFIEFDYEEYDFAIEKEFLEDVRVKKFIDYIKSKEFIEKLEEIGGYRTENIGDIEYI